MPSIYDLKPRFQALLRPLTAYLAKSGITANQVTLAALALSIAAGMLITLKPGDSAVLLIIPLLLLLRMALNAIDGMLAREHALKSSLGAVLNELGDVIADAALYLPMALIPGVSASLVVLVVVLAIISEMAGVVAIQIGAARGYAGPMGKSDRAFVFGVMALLLGLGVLPGFWIQLLLSAVLVLLCLTIINRVRNALQEVAA